MKACKFGPLAHPVGRRRCKKAPKHRKGWSGPIQQFSGSRRRRRR